MPTNDDNQHDRRKSDAQWREHIQRDIAARHKENRDSIARVEGATARLEGRVSHLETEGEKMRAELKENTAVTREVKTDTATLVSLFRNGTALGKFLLWASPVASAFFAGWSIWSKK